MDKISISLTEHDAEMLEDLIAGICVFDTPVNEVGGQRILSSQILVNAEWFPNPDAVEKFVMRVVKILRRAYDDELDLYLENKL